MLEGNLCESCTRIVESPSVGCPQKKYCTSCVKLSKNESLRTAADRREYKRPDNQPISPELEAAVVEFLTGYWMAQGLTQGKAIVAAQNALVSLRANKSDETWVLLAPV